MNTNSEQLHTYKALFSVRRVQTISSFYIKYLEYVQEDDLVCDGAMTDPKRDRSLSPHEQNDPDHYLHIVEEQKDGIIACDDITMGTAAVGYLTESVRGVGSSQAQ